MRSLQEIQQANREAVADAQAQLAEATPEPSGVELLEPVALALDEWANMVHDSSSTDEVLHHGSELANAVAAIPAGWTNDDGIRFEPVIFERQVGYRVTDLAGRVEMVLFSPSDTSSLKLLSKATASTFVYRLDELDSRHWEHTCNQLNPGEVGVVPTNFGYPVTHINHFPGTAPEHD